MRRAWAALSAQLALNPSARLPGLSGQASQSPIVITVGGTNGKGSACALLESILVNAGYQVGCYTSPYFFDLAEAIRINAQPMSTQLAQRVSEQIGATAIEGLSLSPFECDTLTAFAAFSLQGLDVWILEIGMGGRTDAVNVVDPDCSILTNVALDHQAWLGPDREAIGLEKAHIFRPGRPAIVADPQPPQSVIDHAKKIQADLWRFGHDFNYSGDRQQWAYGGRHIRRHSMAYPGLRGANQLLNASAVLAALEALRDRLPVTQQAVRQGLAVVELPGRFQVLPGRPTMILDVAHNPHAAGHLAANLDQMGFFPFTYAVCGMLADKDHAAIFDALLDKIDHWLLIDLPGERGCKAEALAQTLHLCLRNRNLSLNAERTVETFSQVSEAMSNARGRAGENDRIVVFGSFLTVGAALQFLGRQ